MKTPNFRTARLLIVDGLRVFGVRDRRTELPLRDEAVPRGAALLRQHFQRRVNHGLAGRVLQRRPQRRAALARISRRGRGRRRRGRRHGDTASRAKVVMRLIGSKYSIFSPTF